MSSSNIEIEAQIFGLKFTVKELEKKLENIEKELRLHREESFDRADKRTKILLMRIIQLENDK